MWSRAASSGARGEGRQLAIRRVFSYRHASRRGRHGDAPGAASSQFMESTSHETCFEQTCTPCRPLGHQEAEVRADATHLCV